MLRFDPIFAEEFEKSQNEFVVFLRRIRMTKRKKHSPTYIKNNILKSSLLLIMNSFHNGKFGIISTQRNRCSVKKNLKFQYEMVQKLKRMKFHPIAHTGFWEGISNRCLFIPWLTKEQMKILAKDFKFRTYIWGEKGKWDCIRTSDNSVIATGRDSKIICIDCDFLIFSRIMRKKTQLIKMKTSLTKINEKPDYNTQQALLNITSKIGDIQRIEDELVGSSTGG